MLLLSVFCLVSFDDVTFLLLLYYKICRICFYHSKFHYSCCCQLMTYCTGNGSGIDDKITKLGDQLQYIVELVERKTVQKDGSKASVGEFKFFFAFSNCPAGAWLTNLKNTEFSKSAPKLISVHKIKMIKKRDAGLVDEVAHVQGDSKVLLQQLMDLYFAGQHVELMSERPYSCKVTNRALESIRYNGNTDAVIKCTEYDIAVLCWEVKNQLVNLLSRSEIAQTAAEVAGELEVMFNTFDIKPRRYAAVLTNGVAFLFIMATLVNGVYSWIHSPLVDNADSAAAMIEGCFAIATEVLQLLDDSFHINMGTMQLVDSDNNDNGSGRGHTESDEAGSSAKSGALGSSLGGFTRSIRSFIGGANATKSSGGANATKKDIGPKKSDNSQDYRYAPLTMSYVDLFNKMRGSLFSF